MAASPIFTALADEADTWAALRCQSSQTLALADRLGLEGVGGWSPRVSVQFRVARRRRTATKIVPLLPSFVFVPFAIADVAVELGRRGRVPRSWPFLFNGDRPVLPVDQLMAMQSVKAPRQLDDLYKPGDRVRFVIGPLRGLDGIILSRKGRDRWLVDMDGRRVWVPSFLIAPVSIKDGPA